MSKKASEQKLRIAMAQRKYVSTYNDEKNIDHRSGKYINESCFPETAIFSHNTESPVNDYLQSLNEQDNIFAFLRPQAVSTKCRHRQ